MLGSTIAPTVNYRCLLNIVVHSGCIVVTYNGHTHTYICMYMQHIPYSLKLSGTKIFVDFMIFQASTKILSMKISYISK